MNAPDQSSSSAGYGRIARMYQALEYVAFGRDLERTRSTFLETFANCSRMVVFGAGDGRCFRDLLPSAPLAHVTSIEADAEMSDRARAVVTDMGQAQRVAFVLGDAREYRLETGHFDGAVTQFFLDCFTAEELDQLIPRIAGTLKPGAPWLFADFAIPERPVLARWRARLWIASLCAFFRWQAGHRLKTLPPMEYLLLKHGLHCERERARSWGLLRAAIYSTGTTVPTSDAVERRR